MIIYGIFFENKTQTQMAEIMGISRQMLTYKLKSTDVYKRQKLLIESQFVSLCYYVERENDFFRTFREKEFDIILLEMCIRDRGVCSVDHPQLLQRVQQALLDFSE